MNVFGGSAHLNVTDLARHRNLDLTRFENLMMKEKTVALPFEDPISFAVNAAKPVVDSLSEAERDRIELIITCTESAIDFGKSMSTYIHHYLGLNRNCRLAELKQACYAGTAGLQMAVGFVLSQASPGAKALVIASDISRYVVADPGEALTADWSYAEPSVGAGAVALLVSEVPDIFEVDVGANGYYGYEVMDSCRPAADSEAGNADLSLLSYLDCCEQSFAEYRKRVPDADYCRSFDYLAFHTPFGGMVKGAHRTMMRKVAKAKPLEIEDNFNRRVLPGLTYCQRVANIMGGTVFLSLASTIDNAAIEGSKRVGVFSYGSGCCSEFFSGVVTPRSKERLARFRIGKQLDARYRLSIDEYESLLMDGSTVKFGTRNVELDYSSLPGALAACKGKPRLFLKRIREFHREYEWVS